MASLLEHTVMPSGGDYTSLDACIDHLVATHPDLVTADVYAEVKIDGTWSSADTAAVTINGLTTDATHYLLVYTTTAARQDPHSVAWDTGAYNIVPTAARGLVISDENVKINGLQISSTTPNGDGFHVVDILGNFSAANQIELSNCIIKGHGHATYVQSGLRISDGNIHVRAWNLIIYNIGAASGNNGVLVNDYGGEELYLYSSSIVGTGTRGIWGRSAGNTVICKNCYVGGFTTQYVDTITKTTCASSDTTGSVGLQNIAADTDTFVNVSAGTEDFHLAADGLSPLQGVGTDTSGDAAPMNFTTDIDGDTRDATWDIGADAVVAGGNTYNEAITLSSTPACSHSPQADLLGSLALASTPALSPAAIADLLGSVGLASTPAASMIGGMDYSAELALLSNPAFTVSAIADFYNSLSLASTPAAVMAAVADLIASLALASDPAFAALGGSDFYESLALSSDPAFASAVFKEAFGELTLASSPALAAAAIADLCAIITMATSGGISTAALADLFAALIAASSPALLAAAGFDINEAIILASAAAFGLDSSLISEGNLGVPSSQWASKKGLHRKRAKWYRPGVRGQRWYGPGVQ